MRFRLRTLMIVLALGPLWLAAPRLAWQSYREYRIKRAIDEFNRGPVRPQQTIYVSIGPAQHDAAEMEMHRKKHEEQAQLWLKALNAPQTKPEN